MRGPLRMRPKLFGRCLVLGIIQRLIHIRLLLILLIVLIVRLLIVVFCHIYRLLSWVLYSVFQDFQIFIQEIKMERIWIWFTNILCYT